MATLGATNTARQQLRPCEQHEATAFGGKTGGDLDGAQLEHGIASHTLLFGAADVGKRWYSAGRCVRPAELLS